MGIETLIQSFANALVLGSIYAMVAVGLALAFGVMQMANFAHGELFMAGAYVVYVLYSLVGLPFFIAVIAAFPIVAMLGVLFERAIFRPTRGNVLAGFMATAGASFIMQVLVGQQWGVGLMRSVPVPYKGSAEFLGVAVSWQRLAIIPATIIMVGGLWFFLKKIKAGKALRACAQDTEAAVLQGISINKMTVLAMFLSGGFAGVGGALMAPIIPVTPYMGHVYAVTAFIVVIVGGMASIEGAVLAAFILGFIHTFVSTLYDSVTATMVGVLFMAVVLIVKPTGLLGHVKV
ncbi:MAG: branched-chain amino acid ABC transporter permease [Gammaproteobacteria bacterium]|nr:branched-chain amino acid ABC transporter permease [Gammaproteobacteria bacterium]MDH3447823.1 branched-chain amino acid ABC transporter permease [Gammaproteobacteria bacterium]